jgi:multimeric flavodoxin WrbA
MNEPILNDEGRQMLTKVLSMWPPIIRERKKERIMRILSWIMGARGVAKAGETLVMEAVKEIVPKSYDPIFHMWEDMEKFNREFLATFDDMEAYNNIPVRVKRWERQPAEKASKPSEAMTVVAFCASPRKGGNTDLLVDEALKGAMSLGAKGEKIMLQKIKMGFCVGCRRCKDTDYEQMCIIKDDMNDVYQKIMDADAIIIGFPIYTGRECAQLSTFLDRWDCFERGSKVDNSFRLTHNIKPGKKAMIIGTWGYSAIDTYDHVIENIISIVNLHAIQPVEAVSACGFEGILHGLDENKKGVIAKLPEELGKAYQAGVGLVAE